MERDGIPTQKENARKKIAPFSRDAFKIVAYHTFPSRTILKSPFQKRTVVQYGIVAFSWKTQRWLLTQHKHSPPFLQILQGSYRNSELPRLLKHTTLQELALIQKLSKVSFHFNKLFFDTFPTKTIEELVYAKERFFGNGPLFLHYEICRDQPTAPRWEFPNEIPLQDNENSVDCALRALKMNAGLDITRNEKSFLGRDPFYERAPSIHEGQRCESRFWLVIYMKEPRISPFTGGRTQGEAKTERIWCGEDDAMDLLLPSKQRVLQEAKKFIQENFLF